ncbi:MAG: lysylphosphatidylglycerol synthase domain-containing protein [Xanthobacteraceae bacterium]
MLTSKHGSTPIVRRRFHINRLGVMLSAAIFVIAAIVLYHILRDINPRKLLNALKATDRRTLIIAGCFVAGGYLTLTFYDLFALRTIGRTEIPYRIAALGSFTSYAVGHNIGASVFSGGAVRYHIYSSRGLSVIDVTKICFVAGLTFWLGNVTVLGLGILYTPAAGHALDQLPLWLNRGLGLVLLALLAAYVAWVWTRPRVIGRDDWQVSLPGGTLTLVQIVIGIVDLSCCAAAMYMLMPDQPNIGFVTVAVIFVAATLLGFASHAPGGLGVFDAAMLVALWQFQKEDLLAGLLLFRLLYYICPFVLSLIVLGTREVLLNRLTREAAQAALPPIGAAGKCVGERADLG